MKCKYRNIVTGICMTVLSEMAYADDTVLNLALPSVTSAYTKNSLFQQLASNEGDVVKGHSIAAPVTRAADPTNMAAEFEPPLFSGRKAHQYLGLGTLALVGLTALTAPDHEHHGNAVKTTGLHPTLGRAAAAMAAATVTTGLLYHWNGFHLEDGLTDPDNMHWMLASAGALAMLYAVSQAPASSHSSAGMLGGVAMVVAVKLTW